MRERSFSIPSFAKINWFLKVIGKREDGFHEICTAFQTVSLHDTIEFRSSGSVEVSSDSPGLPQGSGNLVHRAAEALQNRYGIKAGARIRITKTIPFPGGLGGGSSNAAMALLGLCELWDISPDEGELIEIAASLGSDVPFFLCGGTALGTGRGTELEPLNEVSERYLLIATPAVDVPTAKAFDLLGRDRLTKEDPNSILNVCRDFAERLISRRLDHFNDFEEAVFELAPDTARTRELMDRFDPIQVRLSGSGSSLFGIFDNDESRMRALDALRSEPGMRVFAVQTVSRARFREALGSCGDRLPEHFR